MKKIEIDKKTGRKRVYTVNNEPSKTDQSYAKESDVNFIISKYKKTGMITHLAKKVGQYMDVSEVKATLDMMDDVKGAMASFMDLPASIRKFFDNDYKKLVMFMADPKNLDKAIELGLVDEPEGYQKPDSKSQIKVQSEPAKEGSDVKDSGNN